MLWNCTPFCMSILINLNFTSICFYYRGSCCDKLFWSGWRSGTFFNSQTKWCTAKSYRLQACGTKHERLYYIWPQQQIFINSQYLFSIDQLFKHQGYYNLQTFWTTVYICCVWNIWFWYGLNISRKQANRQRILTIIIFVFILLLQNHTIYDK